MKKVKMFPLMFSSLLSSSIPTSTFPPWTGSTHHISGSASPFLLQTPGQALYPTWCHHCKPRDRTVQPATQERPQVSHLAPLPQFPSQPFNALQPAELMKCSEIQRHYQTSSSEGSGSFGMQKEMATVQAPLHPGLSVAAALTCPPCSKGDPEGLLLKPIASVG